MIRFIFIFFISLVQLFSSNIDVDKEAIYLGYVSKYNDSHRVVNRYKKNDLYIYKTEKDGKLAYDIYLVNIHRNKLAYYLNKARAINPSSTKISKLKLKYFARDISDDNIFISHAHKSSKKKKIAINKNKKAIYLSCALNIKDAKKLAHRYNKHDVYIYNTIKSDIECYAIYIVNVENKKVKSLLSSVMKIFQTAKEVPKIKIKYFAKDKSNENKLIASRTS